MTNIKSTKRALITSVIAMFLCFAMLVGTTYAWFTSTVTSAGNVIQTGTLNVTLEYSATKPVDENDANWLDASQGAIFNYKYWEPGYTDVKYIKVQNEGTLDLQYLLTVVPNDSTEVDVDLAEVIDVYMFEGAEPVIRDMLDDAHRVGTVADLMANPNGAAKGVLYAKQNADPANGKNNFDVYTVVLKMQETAGNEYQGLNLGGGFTVNLLATQYTSEYDSFDNMYDDGAKFPMIGSGSAAVVPNEDVTVKIANANTTSTSPSRFLATVVIPAEAIADGASNIDVIVKEELPQSQSNLGIEVDGEVKTFEINVAGVKAGNTEPIDVYLYVGKDQNVGNVVYHTLSDGTVEELVIVAYTEGFIRFKTTSFSPFSVVIYDEPLVTNDKDLPIADVQKVTLGEAIVWNDDLGFIPSYVDQQLEQVYSFKSPHTVDNINDCEYKDWICDYYVKFVPAANSNITMLPEGTITLGGYYGTWGWVGFDNPEVEVNTYIPLLGSVTQIGWTYDAIVSWVGEFMCGVSKAENSTIDIEGAQFIVELRLTNPDDEAEYYAVNKVTYTFGAEGTVGTSVIESYVG